MHEGYMPIVQVLRRYDCALLLSAADLSTREEPRIALADPEALLLYVRTCASAQLLQARPSLGTDPLPHTATPSPSNPSLHKPSGGLREQRGAL